MQEQEVEPGNIAVWGHSLGGPIAAWLAQQHTPGRLVLEATFTAIPDLGKDLYPIFPARLLARYHYNTREYLSRVMCPVLVVHSRGDELIPFAHGQQRYEAAGESGQFLEVEGGHNDGLIVSGERCREALKAFIASRRL